MLDSAFFTEAFPLAVPLAIARHRLYRHPDFPSVLSSATLAALGDHAAALPSLPAPGLVRVACLPARQRRDTTVVAMRWFADLSPGGLGPGGLVPGGLGPDGLVPDGDEKALLLDADLELRTDRGAGARLALIGSQHLLHRTGQPAEPDHDQERAVRAAIRTVLARSADALSIPGAALSPPAVPRRPPARSGD